jgi:hypothetical protein
MTVITTTVAVATTTIPYTALAAESVCLGIVLESPKLCKFYKSEHK